MSPLEIEIKAWCSDFDVIVSLLEKMGARGGETRLEDDIYYNHPARDFRSTDEALRIRRVNDRYVLTYKGPKLSEKAKTRVEHEVTVDDLESMEKILVSLGFVESGAVHKERTIYHLGDVEVCLDRVRDLGFFVEIEKMGTEKEAIENELFRLAEELHLVHFERRSYLELVLYGADAPF